MNCNSYLRLVLFDIDGTLISTNGLAREAFADALERVLQIETAARAHDFTGKTDQQIYREIMNAAGLSDEVINAKFHEVFETFFSILEERLLPECVTVLNGIPTLLSALKEEPTITLGLLTGNMIRGARIKLNPPKLNHYFVFGAFGSDSPSRFDLPSIAVERAYHRTGYIFREKEIIVIGDTIHDIECGRHLNVRTIAIASGLTPYETLSERQPDFLFRDCSDTNALLDAILQ